MGQGKFFVCFVLFFKMCNIKSCLYVRLNEPVQKYALIMLERQCSIIGTNFLGRQGGSQGF